MAADFLELRRKMVDSQIRTVDVTRLSVLSAFLTVPREAFVPEQQQHLAYLDEDILVKAGSADQPARYMMEPAPLAKLIQLADVKEDDVVLDIGAGTGYCASIVSKLAGSVIALESDAALAKQATANLSGNDNDNVVVVQGKLEEGYAAEGPYNVIIIEGAVDIVPEAVLEQLKEGGRLVVVEGHGNGGVARYYLREDGVISGRRAFNLAVKPLAGFLKKPEFVF